jgi:ubiquinone/menaquinone biosynthesis C-methylase UbiE
VLNDARTDRFRRRQVEFHRDADIGRFENRIRNPFLLSKETLLARRIAGLMPGPNGRVLEIGSGEGSNLWFLHQQLPSCRFAAMDFSVAKVHFLNGRMSSVNAVAGDALHIPFRTEQFDLVLCRDLLHHVNWDRDLLVREALRVLRPGGVLVVLESNGRAILSRIFRLFYPVERGMRDSTPETLMALGKRHGPVRLEFVEASFLVRAVAFTIGWPAGSRRGVLKYVYRAAVQWERVVERLLPPRRWIYMLLAIERS